MNHVYQTRIFHLFFDEISEKYSMNIWKIIVKNIIFHLPTQLAEANLAQF